MEIKQFINNFIESHTLQPVQEHIQWDGDY